MKKYFKGFQTMKQTATSKHLYTHEELLQDLKNNITAYRNKLEGIQKVINKSFPEVKFDENFIKILFTYESVVYYYIDQVKENKARELGLNCMYGADLTAAPATVKDDRKLVEAMAAAELRVLEDIKWMLKYRTEETRNLLTYVRSGVIYVGSKNEVCVSYKAEELLEDYCSVDIKTSAEESFYKGLLRYQDSVKEVEKAHLDLVREVKDSELSADLSELTFQYGEIRLSTGFCVSSDSFLWRAMLNYCIANRKDDTPHFYNKVGLINEYDAEEIYKATGYRPRPTAGLRVRYPNLYKNIPFTQYEGQAGNPDDTREQYEELIENKVKVNNFGFLDLDKGKKSASSGLNYSVRRM